jgi:hypothetical protein
MWLKVIERRIGKNGISQLRTRDVKIYINGEKPVLWLQNCLQTVGWLYASGRVSGGKVEIEEFRTDYKIPFKGTKTRFLLQEPGYFSGCCFKIAS